VEVSIGGLAIEMAVLLAAACFFFTLVARLALGAMGGGAADYGEEAQQAQGERGGD
jgi:hypothetical protein